ncbi:MAG: hypothetical protein J5J06_19350 [Phycisphaerae bacterium]|nr:hypothetical protein [Phycisphaerae bacterium]
MVTLTVLPQQLGCMGPMRRIEIGPDQVVIEFYQDEPTVPPQEPQPQPPQPQPPQPETPGQPEKLTEVGDDLPYIDAVLAERGIVDYDMVAEAPSDPLVTAYERGGFRASVRFVSPTLQQIFDREEGLPEKAVIAVAMPAEVTLPAGDGVKFGVLDTGISTSDGRPIKQVLLMGRLDDLRVFLTTALGAKTLWAEGTDRDTREAKTISVDLATMRVMEVVDTVDLAAEAQLER